MTHQHWCTKTSTFLLESLQQNTFQGRLLPATTSQPQYRSLQIIISKNIIVTIYVRQTQGSASNGLINPS